MNRIEGDYLFSNVDGTNILMYSLVDRLWRSAKIAAGITRKITSHRRRHFFASAGLSKGVPVTDMGYTVRVTVTWTVTWSAAQCCAR
ncbi:site-specific integrase [Streptomyces vinaceus]|uniref:hypothetical protein n=1 Tax=Streptomyces vinaceus TaxID=1960 RepID=UPI0036A27E5C